MGTGVGSKAYAIIEQGRIGFIVSSRPEDRRGLIDEAAGITSYKVKKKAAERRMDATRQHLLRVSDVVGEIEGRLRSLRLQAQKAERYKRYKAELKDLDLWSSAQRYLGHLAEEKSLISEIGELRTRHEVENTALLTAETSMEADRLAVSEEANELATAREDLFALSNRAQLDSQRAQHQESESVELASRAEAGQREAAELRAAGSRPGRQHRRNRPEAGGNRRGGRRQRSRVRDGSRSAGRASCGAVRSAAAARSRGIRDGRGAGAHCPS